MTAPEADGLAEVIDDHRWIGGQGCLCEDQSVYWRNHPAHVAAAVRAHLSTGGAAETGAGLTGDESYPGHACPEHGPRCSGPGCCCRDKHRRETGAGLRAAVDWIRANLPMSDDGTGHVVDCGYTEDDPECGCLTLPGRLADYATDRDLRARIEALHVRYQAHGADGCDTCRQPWPCETIAALAAAPTATSAEVGAAALDELGGWYDTHDAITGRGILRGAETAEETP